MDYSDTLVQWTFNSVALCHHTPSLTHASGTIDPMKTGQKELENKGGCRPWVARLDDWCTYVHVGTQLRWQRKKARTWCFGRACDARLFSRPDTARIWKKNAKIGQHTIYKYLYKSSSLFVIIYFVFFPKAQLWWRWSHVTAELLSSDDRGCIWWKSTLLAFLKTWEWFPELG